MGLAQRVCVCFFTLPFFGHGCAIVLTVEHTYTHTHTGTQTATTPSREPILTLHLLGIGASPAAQLTVRLLKGDDEREGGSGEKEREKTLYALYPWGLEEDGG